MESRAFYTTSALVTLVMMLAVAGAGRVVAVTGEERTERTMTAQPGVTISVCLTSGDIKAHGWDRNEVRVRSDAEKIELRRADGSAASAPASHLEVLLADAAEGPHGAPGSCRSFSDVELDVPRGATVQLNTRDGNITVTDVAEARVQTMNGDVTLQHVSKSVDASSISGNISLKDSNGHVTIQSVSGSVEVTDARPINTNDDFEAKTVSGDITLNRVGHARVQAGTVSGSTSMTGPLAHGGRYDVKTLSGDVTLVLPADSSFQINAKVSRGGEIITDFPLRLMGDSGAESGSNEDQPEPSRKPHGNAHRELRRLIGTYGSGDAVINLASFSGTLHLQKK